MDKKTGHTERSSSDLNEESPPSSPRASLNDQPNRLPTATKTDSIKHYVKDVLGRLTTNDQETTNLGHSQIEIDPPRSPDNIYDNTSSFRNYGLNNEATAKSRVYQRSEDSTSDDDLRSQRLSGQSVNMTDSTPELNLDPNPIVEEREGVAQLYKQRVYLRQLQPPTPQPVEIQIHEVLVESQNQKPPLHVRVGPHEPRTPSPVIIKSAPPPPPPPESNEPVIYNKYIPPPKQQARQMIIHRFPDLPPKPRPIIVEQWLPFKPAPKRIIKETLPPEATRTPPPPHNVIVAYGKPRTLVEVELVRLQVVKVDPDTYQKMSDGAQQPRDQDRIFQHERDYASREALARASDPTNQFNWRI